MNTADLKASWARAGELGDQAAEYFYAALFSLDPRLREMFPATLGRQRGKLLAALGHIVSNVDDADALLPFVRQLGVDHRRFEVRPEHYPLVGRALLHTLATALGDEWTPELEADWTAAYELVAATMQRAAADREATEPPYWDAEIVAHERRTGDVAVLTVRPGTVLPYRAGQSLAVETHLRPRMWRYLSPANLPRRDGTLDFHVRAVAGGHVSLALVYQAQKGDLLRLGAPIGSRLTLPAGPGPDLLLLAGGTGVAPLKAVVEQVATDLAGRRVTLVVGAAYGYELYDQPSLSAMAAEYPWLEVVPALTDDLLAGNRGTVAEVARRIPDWHHREVYVCGSPAMVAGTREELLGAGYPPSRLHVEQYDGESYAPLRDQRGTADTAEWEGTG